VKFKYKRVIFLFKHGGDKNMRKVTISLAVSLLVATGAFAGDKYRIFLGAYSGPTVEEMVKDVTPKLKGVEGISDVIAEKRGDKTFVYVNVNEEGESAAKALLPTVKEKSGINDAYCLAVKRMAGAKNETKPVKAHVDEMLTSLEGDKSKKVIDHNTTVIPESNKTESNATLPVMPGIVIINDNKGKPAEVKPAAKPAPKPAVKKPVKAKEKKLDPSFTSVKIEKAKELSEIVGNTKVEEISPITPRPNKEINDNLSEKKKKNLKGDGYNFYQIKKRVEKSDEQDAKDFDALLRARMKAHEQKVQTEKAEAK
jgi:hypothetical protein